jgi:hypothetical protein
MLSERQLLSSSPSLLPLWWWWGPVCSAGAPFACSGGSGPFSLGCVSPLPPLGVPPFFVLVGGGPAGACGGFGCGGVAGGVARPVAWLRRCGLAPGSLGCFVASRPSDVCLTADSRRRNSHLPSAYGLRTYWSSDRSATLRVACQAPRCSSLRGTVAFPSGCLQNL